MALAKSKKADLWLRIRNYHFDHLVPPHLTDRVAAAFGGPDASTKAFASKLSRKLGWDTKYAVGAIGEYKKFLYLGLVSDFYVTPPKDIDKVWHEHLLFSKGYREFCRDVLQQDFDHTPELVATPAQTETFQAQYEATLDLYQREFNAQPPARIWGTPKFKPGAAAKTPKKVQKRDKSTDYYYSDSTPLYMSFGDSDSGHASHHHEFGGGGEFSGGGSSGSWSDPSGHGDGHGDSGSSDGGSSDGGGSGCSSGCGGGGCGGD